MKQAKRPRFALLIDCTLRSFLGDNRLMLKSQEAIARGDGYIATVADYGARIRRGGTPVRIHAVAG